MIWGAVIVAAGRGTRFGRPKQLVELNGRPMLGWSVAAFASMPEISDITIVTEPEFVAQVEALANPLVRAATLRVVPGGADRQASAAYGIEALADHCSGIFVHDGARPMIRRSDVRAGMRVVRYGVAALLATPAVDTMKVAGEDGRVTRTLERATLWAAQTPQFATARDFRRTHADAVRHNLPRVTDDAALLERAGHDVLIVEGSPDNFKVTTPDDLRRAEAVLREREAAPVDEEEVLLVECFVAPAAVDAVLSELEGRDARIDGVERDLPDAVAIRAYANAQALYGFGRRLHALAGDDSVFTTHLSHVAPRAPAIDRHH